MTFQALQHGTIPQGCGALSYQSQIPSFGSKNGLIKAKVLFEKAFEWAYLLIWEEFDRVTRDIVDEEVEIYFTWDVNFFIAVFVQKVVSSFS